MNKNVRLLIFVMVGWLLGFLLSWVSRAQAPPELTPDYQIIHVQGMPCVAFDNGDFAGLSCDWTRWEGDAGWK